MDIDYRGRGADPALRWRLRIAAAAIIASIAAASAPNVLAAVPSIVSTPSSSGFYTPATPDIIAVEVEFDVDVYVSGRPVFDLMVGTARRTMAFAGVSDSTKLRFEYAVQKGDLDEDGIGWAANALTGGTIRDTDSAIVARAFAALARDPDHRVDGVAPRLVATPLQVTSNPMERGTYGEGETIALALEFDEVVRAADTDDSLALNFDGVEKDAARGAPDGGTLSFTYPVEEGDLDTNGFVVPSVRFTVADTHGNVDERTTPRLRSPQRVDGVSPTVVRTAIVSNPGADRTYGQGDEILVEVVFSEPVEAAASTFTLLIGPPDADDPRLAAYHSGDGTNRVRYRYEVPEGDRDADGISYADDALSSGIMDRVRNPLEGNVTAVTAQTGHRVDAGEDNEPPVVTGVSITSSPERANTYDIGQIVEVAVEFNEPVSVTSPAELHIELTMGDAIKRADFVPPSPAGPAATLRFRYTVATGDVDANGIAIGRIAESLVGGSIEDRSGNTAIRDFAALPAQPGHKVDGIVPVVTGVAITSDAGSDSTYAVGDEIEVRVDFSEPVVADHDPELLLGIGVGAATRSAHLARGERTSSLTFRYRVLEGDVDTDGIAILSTALTGGSVQDLSGNDAVDDQADLALAAQPAHKVDAAATAGARVVVLSSAGSDRTYALGDLIEVQVQFAEDVVVSGTVELILSFGINTPRPVPGMPEADPIEPTPSARLKRRAMLVRQTARHLTFHYRVQAGDLDEDGLSVDPHALTGGTVVDAFGNPARLLTEFVDDAMAPLHRVDGVEPVVAGIQVVSDAGGDDTYGLGEDIEIEVSFSEVVHTQHDTLTLVVQIGSQARHAQLVDGRGTRTLLFRYTVVSADRDADGISVPSRAMDCEDLERFDCIVDNAGNLVREPIDGLAAQPRHKVDGRRAEPTLSIESKPSSGDTYGAGEGIEILLRFPAPVYVTDDPDVEPPALLINVGGGAPRAASFVGGSATRTLRFSYTVRAGDRDEDGISIGPGPTALHGGRIVDANDSPVSRVFAGLGPAAEHRVDGIEPTVIRAVIKPPEEGEFGLGDEIVVQVTFAERVHVRDASGLALILAVGRHSRRAGYTDGSGSDTLRFAYRVAADDRDDDGVSIGPDAVVGGVIEDGAGNDWVEADRRIPPVPPQRSHRVDPEVDNVPPTVVSIEPSPSPGSTYQAGESIVVTVRFSEVVHVSGEPTLELSIGPAARQAALASGSGTSELQFRYVVQPDDVDKDGISIGPGPASLAGGTIADGAGNVADRAFPGVKASEERTVNRDIDPAIKVKSGPQIERGPVDTAYGVGETIQIEVEFTDVVYVTGQPVLVLSVGANDRDAGYVSGSGTETLTFGYVVRLGDTDTDGVSIPANGLTGGEITDQAGNPVDRHFRALPARDGPKVGDSIHPRVASIEVVRSASGDTFILDDRIEIRVMFSENVVVAGSPAIDLLIGTKTREAAYALGSGTDTLAFRYRVADGDEDDDGVSIPADALPPGVITDAAGNAADLDLRDARTRFRFNVDAVAPVIRDAVAIVPPSSGETFVLGDLIEVRVPFSEPVTVTGQPTVELSIGPKTRRARLASGSGTDTLVFRYQVAAGDEDEDGVSIDEDALKGGTIADIPGNHARRAFDPVPADDRFKVDAVVPGVVDGGVEIASDPGDDDTYVPGDVVEVEVTFTDFVHVTGEPVLTLSIGGNSRPAAFASGSGTPNLFFRYTVVAGDYDEDGISIAANALTGGAITDDSGNPVDRAFPAIDAQSDHMVGAETVAQLGGITLRIGQRHAPIDLARLLRDGGIRYAGAFAATSDNPAVATATTNGSLLTVVPVSEGTATIELVARQAPITLFLPVTVQASEAETAVLQSALAAVGRGLLGSAADMIGARLELAAMPAGQGAYRANYGGTPTMPPTGEDASVWPSAWHTEPDAFGMPGGFVDHGARGPTAPRAYRPRSFAIPLAGMTSGTTSWGAWGAAGYRAFEGTPEAGSYDGNLTSFHLGADARAEGWVAGASVSRSQASVSYTFDGDATGAGTLDTSLTALHPYVQWRPGPGTTFWTILGFGAGEATVEREGRTAQGEPATLGMRLGLAGLRMDLGRPGGFALALRGDAGFVQLETEDGLRAVDGLSVQAQRLRAGVEASRPMSTTDGILSPFVEIGARWDGGDGEAGGGIEIAGGVRYRGSSGGVEIKARTLAMHGGEGVAEHGIAATAFIEPGSGGTGLRLSLTPRWGSPESRDVFWQSDYGLRGMRHDVRSRHWMLDAQVGYGLALRGRPGRLEPFGAVAGSPRTDSRARVGVRYEAAAGDGVSRYEVSTERVEGVGRVDHRLLLGAEARF